jgi:endonuclease/exonuclease/phosphatase family metal-dependent hydrolase
VPTFVNNTSVQSPLLGPIPLNRGYVLVDATLDGTPFQFVSTHLDETHSANEPAQAGEILAALGATGEPQLVVGDFNAGPGDACPPTDPSHPPCGPAEMLAAGFTDAGEGLGPTCCQLPDLNTPTSNLTNHYDYIFERDFSSIASAFLIGDQPFEEMRPFWTSDHAGVVATLTLAAVPEPATASLLLMPMVLLIGFARLRGHRQRSRHP